MNVCSHCNEREAVQRVQDALSCDQCLRIGEMRVEPNAVFPYHAQTVWGDKRTGVLDSLGLENLPAAIDLVDELFTLERMGAQAQRDMLAATHTRVLSILGPRQYQEAAYNQFADDMMAQVRETKALRLELIASGRPYSPDFVGLSLAAMYVAWIASQKTRVQNHMERVDALLTFKIGAQRAARIEQKVFAHLGAFKATAGGSDLPAIQGEVTRQKLDDAMLAAAVASIK